MNRKCILGSGKLSYILHQYFAIEKIYIANLQRDKEKLIRVLYTMNLWGLKVKIIHGLDFREKTDEALAIKKYVQMKNFPDRNLTLKQIIASSKKVNLKEICYCLTQKKIIEDAIFSGHKKILVFDDDIYINRKIINILENIHDKDIIQNYKILLFGSSDYSFLRKNSRCIKNTEIKLQKAVQNLTCGSFAVAYDSDIFNDIIQIIDGYCWPYDNVTLGKLFIKYKNDCYSIHPSVFCPDVTESSIREAKNQEIENFLMDWGKEENFTVNIAIFCNNIFNYNNIIINNKYINVHSYKKSQYKKLTKMNYDMIIDVQGNISFKNYNILDIIINILSTINKTNQYEGEILQHKYLMLKGHNDI